MITTNVIQRTFHIKVGDATGTCFTIDIDGKQYLITAKHVVKDISASQKISIFHEETWKNIDVRLVGHCEDEIDVSVLAADIQLSPTYSLPASSAGIIYGQDIYFLGFPYGLSGELSEMNNNFPFPLVKKAIVSSLQVSKNNAQLLLLDGHNNPGFSGGPVVFKKNNSNDFSVAGVISGYRYQEEPIYQGTQQLPLAYRYNTGIIISYGIKHAVDLIDGNPIGVALNA